jgi:hypothetical protein
MKQIEAIVIDRTKALSKQIVFQEKGEETSVRTALRNFRKHALKDHLARNKGRFIIQVMDYNVHKIG